VVNNPTEVLPGDYYDEMVANAKAAVKAFLNRAEEAMKLYLTQSDAELMEEGPGEENNPMNDDEERTFKWMFMAFPLSRFKLVCLAGAAGRIASMRKLLISGS